MLKIIQIFLLFPVFLLAQIFVAPDGNDNNPGTIDLPFRSLTKAISLSGPDSLIYLRGGIYYDSTTIRFNKSGQAGKPIKVWAYPGELPVIDFIHQPVSTSSRGFQITHNYWHLKGIEIQNAGDNGIHISSWYNTVENCTIHHCEDTGLQISGGGSYNKIINCDSYENCDFLTNGENADGFAPKLDIGPGNIFKGCRAWGNSDDGWDMYESNDTVVVEDCWAFHNGYNIWGISSFQGDGNGFKLGGNYVAGPHVMIRCVSFDNKAKGFDQNNNIAGITLYNNTAYRNGTLNFAFASTPSSGVHVLKNNISYKQSNSIAPNSIISNNSWQGFAVADSDFLSLDTSLAKVLRDDSGYLPKNNLFRLSETSSMVDAGIDVGLPFSGTAPDLGAFETAGLIGIAPEISISGFYLEQNFPNPFNPSTKIIYHLDAPGIVTLDIFNILGERVAELVNGFENSGTYEITWTADNKNCPTGVYIARLSFNNHSASIKIILIK